MHPVRTALFPGRKMLASPAELDLVAVGRALLADPARANKIRDGREHELVTFAPEHVATLT